MNYKITLLALSVLFLAACSKEKEEDKKTVRNVTQNAVSSTVSVVKDFAGGVVEGVASGRQKSDGMDGAAVVASSEQLTEHKVSVELLSVTDGAGNTVTVQLGFKNASDKTVRLIDLQNTGALLVIDRDGYSQGLTASSPMDITLAADAGSKVDFTFPGKADDVASVRIWGNTLTLKKKG